MNGRELIIFILENGLENEDISSEKFLSCMYTIESVAVTFNVGVATVEAWLANGCLEGIESNNKIYIFPSSLNKFAEKVVTRR